MDSMIGLAYLDFYPLPFADNFGTLQSETIAKKNDLTMTRTVTTLIAVFILGSPLFAAPRASDDGPVVVVVKEKVPEQGSRTNRMPMRALS